jgi:hypothetical protein
VRYPEFSGAIKMNKGAPDDLVERSLFMKARGFWVTTEKVYHTPGQMGKNGQMGEPTVTRVEVREYYPPDTAAAFIWLKNRRPALWRDKHEIVHSGDVNHSHRLADLTASPDDEVQREYAEALGAASQVQLLPPPSVN